MFMFGCWYYSVSLVSAPGSYNLQILWKYKYCYCEYFYYLAILFETLNLFQIILKFRTIIAMESPIFVRMFNDQWFVRKVNDDKQLIKLPGKFWS